MKKYDTKIILFLSCVNSGVLLISLIIIFASRMINMMKRNRLISFLHVLGYALIFISIVVGFVIARNGQDAFLEYLKEDGLVENLTALFLLAASGIAVYRCIRAIREIGRASCRERV